MLSKPTDATTSYSVPTIRLDCGARSRMTGNSDVKAQIRSQQRDWLRKVSALTRQSLSELAVNAGMSDVTLTRLMNRDDYEGVLSPLNVEKIKRYAGVPGPGEPMPDTD